MVKVIKNANIRTFHGKTSRFLGKAMIILQLMIQEPNFVIAIDLNAIESRENVSSKFLREGCSQEFVPLSRCHPVIRRG